MYNCMVINLLSIIGISTWLELVAVGWQCWVITIISAILLISFVEIEKLIIRKMDSRI
jgi:hypothetical protein